jgi:hypothetical protein
VAGDIRDNVWRVPLEADQETSAGKEYYLFPITGSGLDMV